MEKAKNNNRFWNFVSVPGGTTADLYLDGEISSEKSWWYDTITPADFTRELQALGDVTTINVHVNSGGGDVFAAHTIATRLKDHAAQIIAKVSWAASAATIIVAAADRTKIAPGGVYMIHNPKMYPGGYYEAKDFIKMANKLEVIKNSIIEWYMAKTGKEKTELEEAMNAETWHTGREAVENGYIDELMFEEGTEEEPIITNENTVVVNSVSIDLKNLNVPTKIKKLFRPQASAVEAPAAEAMGISIKTLNNGGGKEMEIRNVEEMKVAFPEFCNQLAENAVNAERERIKNIEAVTLAGYEEIANAAKFEKPITAGELSMAIIADQRKQGTKFLNETQEDVRNSNVNEVGTAPQETGASNTNPYDAIINKVL